MGHVGFADPFDEKIAKVCGHPVAVGKRTEIISRLSENAATL